MTSINYLLHAFLNSYGFPVFIALSGFVSITLGIGQVGQPDESTTDDNIVYVAPVKENVASAGEVQHEQQYWISCILQASKQHKETIAAEPGILEEMKNTDNFWQLEVKKNVEKENNKSPEIMRIDRYYWLHYLNEAIPEIE